MSKNVSRIKTELRRQEHVRGLEYRGQSILRFGTLCNKQLRKEGPLVFANGGPKKAAGRGDARWHLIPKEPRRDVFVIELQPSPNSTQCTTDSSRIIPTTVLLSEIAGRLRANGA